MKAAITKITKQPSKMNNSDVYMVCFKCEDGKSRNAWIDTSYRNWSHWNGLLKVGNDLENLIVRRGGIDADSFPKLVKKVEEAPIEAEILPKEEAEQVALGFDLPPKKKIEREY